MKFYDGASKQLMKDNIARTLDALIDDVDNDDWFTVKTTLQNILSAIKQHEKDTEEEE